MLLAKCQIDLKIISHWCENVLTFIRKKKNSLCSSQCGRQLATEIDDLEPLKWKGARGQGNEVMDELLFSASNSLQPRFT